MTFDRQNGFWFDENFSLQLLLRLALTLAALEIPTETTDGRADVKRSCRAHGRRNRLREQRIVDGRWRAGRKTGAFVRQAPCRRAEKELDWYQYRRSSSRTASQPPGVEFWRKHRDLSIRGQRSNRRAGGNHRRHRRRRNLLRGFKGKDPVFDSLVALAFDYPRRARFFMGELEQFETLARSRDSTPAALLGSYAGAMGMPQFISSSYRAYAIDATEARPDRTCSNSGGADIAGSVANYFVEHGWRARLRR